MSRKTSRLAATLRYVLGALSAFLLANCASYILTGEQQARELLREGKTVVLLRLTADQDGEFFDAISRYEDGYQLTLVHLDTGNAQRLGPLFPALSSEARKEGWIWLALEPGSYFMRLDPPFGSSTGDERQVRSWLDNRFRFVVPNTGRVQYIGSFHARCTSTWGRGPESIGDCPGPLHLTDERELAHQVAAPSLRQAGAIHTELVRAYDAMPSVEELSKVRPMAFAVTATDAWSEPDWDRLGERTETTSGGFDLGGGGGCYGPGCGALVFLALIILGGGALVDAVQDDIVRQEWEPCIKALDHSLQGWDLPALFYERFAEGPAPSIIGRVEKGPKEFRISEERSGQAYQSLLRLNIQRILLRNCQEPYSVCVEIAVRAHLLDRHSGQVIYDATYLYTSPKRDPTGSEADHHPIYGRQAWGYQPWPYHAIWERPVPRAADCYPIEALCENDGVSLFRSELEKAVAEIIKAVKTDLGLRRGE